MNNDIIEQFKKAIVDAGYTPPDVIAYDKFHRFKTDKRGKNGWCVLHDGGSIAIGTFGDWATDFQSTWCSVERATFTSTQRAEYAAAQKAAIELTNAELKASQDAAAKQANAIWNIATPAVHHDYLTTKGVQPYGTRVIDTDVARQHCEHLSSVLTGVLLVVPMRKGSELRSLQFITTNGTKRPLTGGEKKGCYFAIGRGLTRRVAIAEGFATSASVHEATALSVAVAFDRGNMSHVAKSLHADHPNHEIVLCADDDFQTEGNPGLKDAQVAAQAVGGYLALPDFSGRDRGDGTDFNDLRALAGLDVVKACIDNATQIIANNASGAVVTGQNDAPFTVEQQAEYDTLKSATLAIPKGARLQDSKHDAQKTIGFALSSEYGKTHRGQAAVIAREWDIKTGGRAFDVFVQADPDYADKGGDPVTKNSIYKLARANGWTPPAEPWGEPTPLPDALPPVMAFDAELLPMGLRDWVMDIADRMQCPPDFPAVGAITALSSLIGAKAVIQAKEKDTAWQAVPNLWGMVVGRPGVMKSPALSEVMKPLVSFECAAREANQAEHDAWEIDSKVAALMADANEKSAKKCADKGDVAGARNALSGGVTDVPDEPLARRFLVYDSTVEKFGEILEKNEWGLLGFRDELHSLLISLERQGQEGARGFYLTGYDGNSSYTVDRIMRGTHFIPRVCFAMLGGIQPGKVQKYVRDAVSGGSSDDGLLQRFGLTVWPDVNEDFHLVDRLPDMRAKQSAWDIFDRLAACRTCW